MAMRRFSFKKGLVLFDAQRRWELVRRLVTGKLQLQDESGELLNLDEAELLNRWLEGLWVIDQDSLGIGNDLLYTTTPRDLATFPERWQQIARKRQAYIQAVNPEQNKYNPARWSELIKAHALVEQDDNPPCPSSVYSWWKRFRNTRSLADLVPFTRSNKPRHADSRFAVFEQAVSELYLSQQRLPKLDVVKRVHEKVRQLNQGKPETEIIKAPTKSTIYRWLSDLQQDVVDRARLGAEAAKVKYRMVLGSLNVTSVLERIEIDHTPVDLIIIDKLTGLNLGRPWLTIAQDRLSRIIWGYYLSFNPPSTHSVLQCLKNGMLPKTMLLAKYPDIVGEWPACGIPDLIAVDNGMDLHSAGLEKTCQELGIQILYCPAKIPWFKGAVERHFKTMANDLIHRMPGTTFSNVKDRGGYPAESLACIDFDLLHEVVVQWIVDVFNVSPHRGIGSTPLIKWKEGASKRPIELPVLPQQLDVITGIPAERVLFHYGLELEGLHYNSRRLQEIRRRSGDNIRLQLKFYENTVAHIQVFDPYAKEYIEVPTIQEAYSQGISRSVHRLVREHARKEFGESFSSEQLQLAKENIQQKIDRAARDKKMANRKQAQRLNMTDSDPLTPSKDIINQSRKGSKSPLNEVPPELPDGLNDALPKFKPLENPDETN
jgi:putative transposase